MSTSEASSDPRYRGDALYVEGVPAEALARRFGTPLYVYSKAAVLARLSRLRAAFGLGGPTLFYALKANSNRRLCALLAREGLGAEVVSGGELARALAAGFPAGRIVFSGVGKTEAELDAAARSGLRAVTVESGEELARLEAAARRRGKTVAVFIRLNPDVGAGAHPHIRTGGGDDKFGVTPAEALRLAKRALAARRLRLAGIHCHIGSQINSPAPFARAARQAATLAARLRALGAGGLALDLGGGLGISYRGERPLDLRRFAAALLREARGAAELALEPGRYLTAEAGLLLTRVLYRKRGRRKRFVIVDAGMSDLARPALYDGWHPVWPARRRAGPRRAVDIVGPICESADYLARDRRLQECRPGDLLAIMKTGAYGFSMSSQYNSRPRAAEVLVDGRRARLIRRRETAEDLVSHEL